MARGKRVEKGRSRARGWAFPRAAGKFAEFSSMPEAPKAEAAPAGTPVSRRGFLSWIGIAWASFSGAMGVASLSTLRYFFPNVLFEPPQTFKAGFPTEYIAGQV